jgi:hypothetical protein
MRCFFCGSMSTGPTSIDDDAPLPPVMQSGHQQNGSADAVDPKRRLLRFRPTLPGSVQIVGKLSYELGF